VLARLLGVDQYGLYSYTLIWVTAVSTLSTLGYDTSSLRFLPEYKVTNEWELLHGFIVTAHKNTLVASILTSCTLIVVALFLWKNGSDIAMLLILSSPLLPLLSLSRIRQYVLRSLKYIIRAEILDILARPFFLGTTILLFHLVSERTLLASTAILINIAVTLLTFTIGTIWLNNRIPRRNLLPNRQYNRGPWFNVSFPLLFMSIMQLVTGYSDTIMLGLLSSYAESGIYSVAVRIASFVGFSLLTINMILAPTITELYYSQNHLKLQFLLSPPVS